MRHMREIKEIGSFEMARRYRLPEEAASSGRARPVPAAYPHAADLGIGMQLTNIARDIHEDAGLGRRYLPASWVGELEPRSILEPSLEERALLVAARKRLLTLAERYYESGRRGLSHLPLRARYGILVAAQNYRAIGPRALRLGNQLDRRAHVSTAAKVGVTMRSLLTGSLTPSFWLRLEIGRAHV